MVRARNSPAHFFRVYSNPIGVGGIMWDVAVGGGKILSIKLIVDKAATTGRDSSI